MRTLLRTIALAMAVVLSMTGCDSDAPNEASADDVKTLTFWGAQETPQAVKDLITAFGEKHGVKTELLTIPTPFEQNTLTKWTTGDRPDVIFWQPSKKFLLQLNPTQNLQDLSDMSFVGRTEFDLARKSGSVDGKVFTATFGFPAVFGLFYNKEVLAKVGVAPPATEEELQAAMRKVKAAGITPLFLAGGDAWTTQVPVYNLLTDAVGHGLIDRINTKQASWTDQAVVDALTTFESYVDQGLVNPDARTAKYQAQSRALLDGKAAFVGQGSWMVGSLAEVAGGKDLGKSLGFIAWPGAATVQWQTSNLGSIQLPRTGSAGREAMARKFVDYATGEGYGTYLKEVRETSVITGVASPSDVPALTAAVTAAYRRGATPSIDMQAAASFGDFPTLVGQLIAGTMSPRDVAAAMQREFEKNAKLLKVSGF